MIRTIIKASSNVGPANPIGRFGTDGTPVLEGQSPRVTTYEYDRAGRTTLVASPEGEIHYEYDEATGRHVRTWTGEGPTGAAGAMDSGRKNRWSQPPSPAGRANEPEDLRE